MKTMSWKFWEKEVPVIEEVPKAGSFVLVTKPNELNLLSIERSGPAKRRMSQFVFYPRGKDSGVDGQYGSWYRDYNLTDAQHEELVQKITDDTEIHTITVKGDV